MKEVKQRKRRKGEWVEEGKYSQEEVTDLKQEGCMYGLSSPG